LRIVETYSGDTGFGIVTDDFNRRMNDLRPEVAVRIALPTVKPLNPDLEVFWIFWETNKLPRFVPRFLKAYSHVWVPSEWLRRVLIEEGIESQTVHLALDPESWSPRPRQDSVFRFLWVNEWIHRKGGDLLLKAFLDSFDEEDDVELVIKAKYTNQECLVKFPTPQEIMSRYPRGPKEKVKIIDRFLPQQELLELYQSSNCYVYPFRTQGASLTLLEAQACGLPCIVTRYGGCLDYVIHEHAYFLDVVDFKPVTKVDFFCNYRSQDIGVEALPSLEQLKSLLRYCYEHPDEAASRGAEASTAVRRTFTWENLRREAVLALSRPRESRHGNRFTELLKRLK